MSDISQQLLTALKAASKHLEYCGYGDRWERECADSVGLPDLISTALESAEVPGALDSLPWQPVSELTEEDRLEPVLYARSKGNGRASVGIAYWTRSKKWKPELGVDEYPASFTYFCRLGNPPGVKR